MTAPKPRKGEVGPFPHDVKPVRPGVYLWRIYDEGTDFYRRWTGKRWLGGATNAASASEVQNVLRNQIYPLSDDYWFGLERPE